MELIRIRKCPVYYEAQQWVLLSFIISYKNKLNRNKTKKLIIHVHDSSQCDL